MPHSVIDYRRTPDKELACFVFKEERSRSAFGYAAGVGGVAYRHVGAAFGIEPNVPPAMRAGCPNA